MARRPASTRAGRACRISEHSSSTTSKTGRHQPRGGALEVVIHAELLRDRLLIETDSGRARGFGKLDQPGCGVDVSARAYADETVAAGDFLLDAVHFEGDLAKPDDVGAEQVSAAPG